MNRTERFYKIDQLLQQRQSVPMSVLTDELSVSTATVKRDIEYLRDQLNAPIHWDRSLRGYRYHHADASGPRYALPGLWFNASEIHALLTMDHLLSDMQPGLLGERIAPLRERIRELLDSCDHPAESIGQRILVTHMAARRVRPGLFETVSSALMARQRLSIEHHNRRSDRTLTREVSPQRLVYYRDNWYLDAWCHLRDGLRRFAIDAISTASAQDSKAKNVSMAVLKHHSGESYGIFTGPAEHRALLRFSPERARWVKREQWHPDQTGITDKQGRYLLTVPYSDPTELVMDILRYGPDVEVIEPQSLRDTVRQQLRRTSANYSPTYSVRTETTQSPSHPDGRRTNQRYYPILP